MAINGCTYFLIFIAYINISLQICFMSCEVTPSHSISVNIFYKCPHTAKEPIFAGKVLKKITLYPHLLHLHMTVVDQLALLIPKVQCITVHPLSHR